MIRLSLWCIAAAFLLTPLSAQEQRLREKAKDAFEELDSGSLTLRFFNALNGKGIAGGTAEIEGIGTFLTDSEGVALFPPPPEDTTCRVWFSAQGYIPSTFEIEIQAGSLFFNRFSVSPAMDIRHMRIVLDWDKEPRDLDAHFVKKDEYHISFRNMKSAADGTAMLDRDDMDSYGPETITVKQVSKDAEYEFFVHDYSNRSSASSTALSRSKSTVKVFAEGRLMNVFKISQNEQGNSWRVFRINRGAVVPVGIVGNNVD
jgi:hypothetical protein